MTIREIALIFHFIGLAMGLGTGFAFMFLGIAASKLDQDEGNKLMLRAAILGKMGHIGLAILLASGIYLIIPYAKALPQMPLLISKLVLFVLLGATIGITTSMMKKAAKGDTVKYLNKTKNLGKANLILSLAIVVLAVLVFR